jgi:hypothetical protein
MYVRFFIIIISQTSLQHDGGGSARVWFYAAALGKEFASATFGRYGGRVRLVGELRSEPEPGIFEIFVRFTQQSERLSSAHFNALDDRLQVLDDHTVREIQSSESEDSDGPSESSSDDDDADHARELDPRTAKKWQRHPCNEDLAASASPKPQRNPRLVSNGRSAADESLITNQSDQFRDMFERFFPVNYARTDIVPLTNETANRQSAKAIAEWTRYGGDMTYDELLVFFGLISFMTIYKLSGDRRRYWFAKDDSTFPAPNFGKYMHWRRFELILQYLTVGDNGNEDDRLRNHRDWFDAVLAKFRSAIEAGELLVLDETLIANKNSKSAHQQFIRRKPEPLGQEFWTLVDGVSGILIGFEMNEGKDVNRQKRYTAEFGVTTAVTLRALERYFDTNRKVLFDSWFCSCKTVEQLILRGLFSLGIVKTAHVNYPKKTLDDLCPKERGGIATLRSKTDDGNHTIYACQFRTSSKNKVTFCTTAFSCAPAPEQYVTRSGRRFDQPVAAKVWYEFYGKVDQFNHVKVAVRASADGSTCSRRKTSPTTP